MSMRALRIGKSVRAIETAFMMKGRAETLKGVEAWAFMRFRRALRAVRLYSSA